MHSSSYFTSCIQAWNGLAGGIANSGVCVNLQASHAVVNDRGDDGNVELLCCNCRSINDVVVELLSGTGLPTWLIPRFARGICRERSSFWVLLSFLSGCVM